MFKIWHRCLTSNIRHMSQIGSLTSDFLTPDIWLQTSDVWHLTSDTRHIRQQTSDITHSRNQTSQICWHQTSDIRHQTYHTSDVWHLTSWHQTSDIRHQTSDIRLMTSDTRYISDTKRLTSDIIQISEIRSLTSRDIRRLTADITEIVHRLNVACYKIRGNFIWVATSLAWLRANNTILARSLFRVYVINVFFLCFPIADHMIPQRKFSLPQFSQIWEL